MSTAVYNVTLVNKIGVIVFTQPVQAYNAVEATEKVWVEFTLSPESAVITEHEMQNGKSLVTCPSGLKLNFDLNPVK